MTPLNGQAFNQITHKRMSNKRDLLQRAVCEPQRLLSLGEADWDFLIRQARRAGVLARLQSLLVERGLFDQIPNRAKPHLRAAEAVAAGHERVIRWEVNRIQRALADTGVPIILLKGAAYVIANLPPAKGRLYSDVDIMVPKEKLQVVENALLQQGWEFVKQEEYDQRYYRTWMHELPPLRHRDRKTIIDVHHSILPMTSRLQPDPKKLLAAAEAVDGSTLRVLGRADMVLHSATHLFHDGDLERGLRDLIDLDDLLRHFGAAPTFWDELMQRAEELGLQRPLFYGIRYTHHFLNTPIPESVLAASESWQPPWPVYKIMDCLVALALPPTHGRNANVATGLARWLLYLRSHWLRMPPWLLCKHLLRKSMRH